MKKVRFLHTQSSDELIIKYDRDVALVYGKVWRYCTWSPTDECTASLSTLSTQLGMSQRTLQRKLNILIKDKWIKRTHSGKSKKEPSTYIITKFPTMDRESIVLWTESPQSTQETMDRESNKDTKTYKDTSLPSERTAEKLDTVSRYDSSKSRDWKKTWAKYVKDVCNAEKRGYTSTELKILIKDHIDPDPILENAVDGVLL